jgi:hypothetical protein
MVAGTSRSVAKTTQTAIYFTGSVLKVLKGTELSPQLKKMAATYIASHLSES